MKPNHKPRPAQPVKSDVPRLRRKEIERIEQVLAGLRPGTPRDAKEGPALKASLSKLRECNDDKLHSWFCRDFTEGVKREDAARENAWQRIIGANVRYTDCRLDNFEVANDKQRVVVDALHEYAARAHENLNAGRGVILFGSVGTGKDHLMIGLLREVIFRVDPVPHVRWMNGEHIRAAQYGDNLHAHPFERLDDDRQRVLMLSDPFLHGTPLAYASGERLFFLADCFNRQRRPVWMTCNCASREDLNMHIGAPTAERLTEGALTLFCHWPSYRQRQTT